MAIDLNAMLAENRRLRARLAREALLDDLAAHAREAGYVIAGEARAVLRHAVRRWSDDKLLDYAERRARPGALRTHREIAEAAGNELSFTWSFWRSYENLRVPVVGANEPVQLLVMGEQLRFCQDGTLVHLRHDPPLPDDVVVRITDTTQKATVSLDTNFRRAVEAELLSRHIPATRREHVRRLAARIHANQIALPFAPTGSVGR